MPTRLTPTRHPSRQTTCSLPSAIGNGRVLSRQAGFPLYPEALRRRPGTKTPLGHSGLRQSLLGLLDAQAHACVRDLLFSFPLSCPIPTFNTSHSTSVSLAFPRPSKPFETTGVGFQSHRYRFLTVAYV